MSTKINEACQVCAADTTPTDKAVACDERWGSFPVKFWRYMCAQCGWVWANPAQREHNNDEYRKRRRDSKKAAGWTY